MRSRLPAILLVPGGLGHRFPFSGYRRFFGLRSWLAVSSVASGRIEFVSQHVFVPQFYGLSIHFQLLSTPCRHDAVTFSYPAGSSAGEGLSPSVHAHSQAHWPPAIHSAKGSETAAKQWRGYWLNQDWLRIGKC